MHLIESAAIYLQTAQLTFNSKIAILNLIFGVALHST